MWRVRVGNAKHANLLKKPKWAACRLLLTWVWLIASIIVFIACVSVYRPLHLNLGGTSPRFRHLIN